MIQTIEVAPADGGWSVSTPALPAPLSFVRGATAEAAARRLAGRLSASGSAVRLIVKLRDGSVGGRFVYAPHPSADVETVASASC